MNNNKTLKKQKVLFVLPNLSAGGAERIMAYIAQNINLEKYESHLLVCGYKSEAVYSVNKIPVSFLNKRRVLYSVPYIFLYLIRYRPDVVISSLSYLNTVLGLMAPIFTKTKFVIREASVVSIMSSFSNSKKFYKQLSKIAYRNIDSVICQSRDMAEDFQHLFNIPLSKINIINNPITQDLPIKNKTLSKDLIKFITIGRLSKEKGYIRLLSILSKIECPFHYTIIGSGSEKDAIDQEIIKLGLQNKIDFIPFTKQIGLELSKNDIFLQGSFVEGFPNAVLESCLVGTPVIAFDVPGGTKEIIQNGLNGLLASNEKDFYNKINQAINMNWIAEDIRNSVISRFNSKKILRQYENLFLN